MTDHNNNRPDACVFMMPAGIILSLLAYMGFTALEMPAGLLLVLAGALSGVKIVRWAMGRHGSNGGPPSYA